MIPRATVLAPVLSLAIGCGTTSIGRGPTDFDLENDGTPAAQQSLHKKYALAYEPFSFKRPGASADIVEAEIQERVASVSTPAWSDEAADYIATSAPADEELESTTVSFDRFAHGPVPTTMLFVGSVLVGAGLGMAAQVNVGAVNGGTVADISWGALNGAVGGILFSIPLMLVYQLTVPLLSASLASADYKRSVRAFNADLEARIRRGAPKTPPAPPPPAAAPTPPSPLDAPNPAPDPSAPMPDPAATAPLHPE